MSRTSIAILVLATVSVVLTTFFWSIRPRKVIIGATMPVAFPEQGFSHDSFEELLQSYVTPGGRVDYGRWQSLPTSVAQLDSYLAAVSEYSPDSSPERFPSRNDALAYWMYGYNAYVIRSIINHWPITSVTDIKAPIEAVKGLGFFYQLRFSFGGEYLSLLDVENRKIRAGFKDARIHFFLNCASESCPIARPELPTGDELEQLLASATTDFINDPTKVFVDHDRRKVFLSTIFNWYEDDFLNDLRARGQPSGNGLLTYVAEYALDELADDLAIAGEYQIEYRDYDWSLNSAN
jgi:hypothetical protein